jgi:transcriptional regulator with XRE-family HTH domain
MNKVKGKSVGRPRRSDSNVDLKAVGLRIRQVRVHVSQEEFAKELGISQAQLSKYELGQSAPPLGVLVTLGKSRGISVDWLLTGKKTESVGPEGSSATATRARFDR